MASIDSQDLQVTICPQCEASFRQLQDEVALLFCPQCRFPLLLLAGKYRLLEIVAKGGFATLYRAEHTGLQEHTTRIVKVLRPDLFSSPQMARRYWQEVQLTANLSQHTPHIVRIYDDFGEVPNFGAFYIMEYLQGESLREHMERAWTLEEIKHLFLQLCEAMETAHEAGVLHRDLKPENLMVITQGHDPLYLKVIDFGIAKRLHQELDAPQVTTSPLGTPAYMSPEQYRAQTPADERTDIFAMGVILYELLTQSHPFAPTPDQWGASGFDERILLSTVVQKPAPLHTRVRSGLLLPDGIEQVIKCAISWHPHDRFTSVRAFREAFVSCVAELPLAPSVRPYEASLPSGKVAFAKGKHTAPPFQRTQASPKKRRRSPLPVTPYSPPTPQPFQTPAPAKETPPGTAPPVSPTPSSTAATNAPTGSQSVWLVLLVGVLLGVVLVLLLVPPEGRSPSLESRQQVSRATSHRPARVPAHPRSIRPKRPDLPTRSKRPKLSPKTQPLPPRRRQTRSKAKPRARRKRAVRVRKRRSLPKRRRTPTAMRKRLPLRRSKAKKRPIRRVVWSRGAPGCPKLPLFWVRLVFASEGHKALRPQLLGEGKVTPHPRGFCVGVSKRETRLKLGTRTEGFVPCELLPSKLPTKVNIKMEREGGLEPETPDYCHKGTR